MLRAVTSLPLYGTYFRQMHEYCYAGRMYSSKCKYRFDASLFVCFCFLRKPHGKDCMLLRWVLHEYWSWENPVHGQHCFGPSLRRLMHLLEMYDYHLALMCVAAADAAVGSWQWCCRCSEPWQLVCVVQHWCCWACYHVSHQGYLFTCMLCILVHVILSSVHRHCCFSIINRICL